MSKKGFVIILVLSIVTWVFSILIQGYIESFISGRVAYSFFGSSCFVTGYPIAQCVNQFESPYGFYLINIFLWFIIIWAVWKLIGKLKS